MIGLCYKDALVLRKQIGFYAIFTLVYAVMQITGVFGIGILAGIVVLASIMLPMSSFAYDDQTRWDRYAAATPAGRRGVVGGKYLLAFMITGLGVVLVAALQLLLALLHLTKGGLAALLLPIPLCGLIALLMNAVLLPLLFKFGAEKSRIISMILCVAVFGVILLSRTVTSGVPVPAIPGWLLSALPVVLVLFCVGCFAISYLIARGIYEKKEL